MTMHSSDAANHARRIARTIDARDKAEERLRTRVVTARPASTHEEREGLREAAKDWHAADDELCRIRTGARP